jgi:hypothetical protein
LFSEWLKELLDEIGVKCRKLALVLNLEYSTVYKWKGGQRIPPLKNHKEIMNQISELFAQTAIEDDICNRRVWAVISKYRASVPTQIIEGQSVKKSKSATAQYISSILIDSYQYSKTFVASEKDNETTNVEQVNGNDKVHEGNMCYGIREQYTILIEKSVDSNADRSIPIIYFNLVSKIDLGIGNTEGSYVKNIQGLIDNGWKMNFDLCIDK